MESIEHFTFPTTFLERYVDDTITVMDKHLIEEFHQHLNITNPSIFFTAKTEKNNTIPFLDVLIIKEEDGLLETTVYRKPTHTGRYLNFNSYCPRHHVEAVIRTLFKRAETHRSNLALRVEEACKLMVDLSRNDYPNYREHPAEDDKTNY